MRCIYCNTPLSSIDYCTGCGADITILKRIIRISNLLYNEGLEKAMVRDMEGAIASLKRSLKFNKENINARNLLGLCYFETGEVVSALCEWVISKNILTTDNIADYYIDQLQANKNKLDTINQTIRKYNQSIMYCRQDNEDMAVIQLKKVLNQNPKFVKAYHLLSLLYLKREEYEKARKLLKKAIRIDATNTTTLRYLSEIEEITGRSTSLDHRRKRYQEDEGASERSQTIRYMSGGETIIQPTTFRDSSTVSTFINILLGIILGGAFVWLLIIPANRQSVNDSANQQVTDANTTLASEIAKRQSLEAEIEGYQQDVDQANKEKEDADKRVESYESLLSVAGKYVGGDQSGAAADIMEIDGEDLSGSAKTLYDTMIGAVRSSLMDQYYLEGTTAYSAGDYQTAAQKLRQAADSDPDYTLDKHYDALYYLGHAYYNMQDYAKANEVFNEIVDKYPAQAANVQSYIRTDLGAADTTGQSGDPNAADPNTAAAHTADPNAADPTAADPNAAAPDTADPTAGGTDGTGTTGEDTYIAWTDPNTGLNYDVYGNLIG